jgi:hypothetical protein
VPRTISRILRRGGELPFAEAPDGTIADRNRYDLFTAAYEHMSGCIDKIYKDLTKSKTFPTGGVGFLSLEDNEVSPSEHQPDPRS